MFAVRLIMALLVVATPAASLLGLGYAALRAEKAMRRGPAIGETQR
jgi:hypothetical protein